MMNSLWCDEEPEVELPVSFCRASHDHSVPLPLGSKDLPIDLISPNVRL